MTFLSEISFLGQNILAAFACFMFVLFMSVLLMVFYITKKQLKHQIQQLTLENNRLQERLAEHS
ncbi:MAG: hypothetical protein Q7T76_18750 [Ferruginibacter sp.]|nr:hypothetical protein [Ferruginibacter sp.]